MNDIITGSNPMIPKKDPVIHIIPQLKELSAGLYGTNKKCGTGATNENCIADFKESVNTLVKRNNYNKMIDENDQYPNTFLGKNFEIVNPQLNIGMYNQNWKNLFANIRSFIIKDNDQKHNIFITSHQHNLQNMFFKLKKTGTAQKYGFRNCTCIKISGNESQIQMIVIHSKNTGRDKSKYQYLEEGDITKYLEVVPESHPLLNTCDIYIIRHGEAIHNLVDVKNELRNTKTFTEAEYNNQITPGNIEMLNAIGDSEKRGKSGNITKAINAVSGVNKPKLNALLTTQGVEQANKLYSEKLKNIINNENRNIYISSPMDRTIQTLIYATSDNGTGFPFLKNKFLDMYKKRFPKTYEEVDPLTDRETMDRNIKLGQQIDVSTKVVPPKRSFIPRFKNPFIRSHGGIRRKSRRNMKRKSKRNKRSKKARKTRKHKKVRRTRRK